MTIGSAASPMSAHATCFTRKRYGFWKRCIAMTAEALYTITMPVHTSSSVAVKSNLSDLSFRAILRGSKGS
jgi:hypothetical protein